MMNEMLKKLYLDAILRPGASKSQHPKSGISRRRRQSVQSEDAKLSLTLKHLSQSCSNCMVSKAHRNRRLSFLSYNGFKKKKNTNKQTSLHTNRRRLHGYQKKRQKNKQTRTRTIDLSTEISIYRARKDVSFKHSKFSRPILPIITQRPLETITTIEFQRRILLRAP